MDKTVFNENSKTEVNNPEPPVDDDLIAGIDLEPGTVIPGGFVVKDRIGTAFANGEADVFLCEKEGHSYAAKFFRRKILLNTRLTEKLKNIRSPRVAKIYDTGEVFDRYYDIYDFYRQGSLADTLHKRAFSFEELKEQIIPNLNEALHDLHKEGILHRDIKPSNIMWSNETQGDLVLIDFGLSSVVRESHSIIVSKFGFTAYYAAPEVLRNVYFDESDYYSMGIVLYELFTGKVPFSEENSYTSIITKPGDMPDELYELILGLTYHDLSFRHDKDNPNRRWTYDEVNRWLLGEKQPIPGQVKYEAAKSDSGRKIPPISFCQKQYSDLDSLIFAMGLNWEVGKYLVYRGRLAEHLRSGKDVTDNRIYWASQVDDIVNGVGYDNDEKMARILYALCPDVNYLFSPMGGYDSIKSFGDALFEACGSFSGNVVQSAVNSLETLLRSGVLEAYIKKTQEAEKDSPEKKGAEEKSVGKEDAEKLSEKAGKEETPEEKKPGGEDALKLVGEFSTRIREDREWNRNREAYTYEFAYRLTGNTVLNPGLPDGKTFSDIEELKAYLMSKKSRDYRELYITCAHFLQSERRLKPRVYGWMKRHGYNTENLMS